MQAWRMADWQTAAERLAALAADVPDAPVVWRNLATLRGWLADNAGCDRRPAQVRGAAGRAKPAGWKTPSRPRPTAMFLADDPLGDRLEMFKLVWTVKDVERAQEAFLSVAAVPAAFRSIRRSSATARRRRRRPPTCCWIAPCPSRPKG